MIEEKHYTDNFFTGHDEGAFSSARIVLPIVQKLVSPSSVIDIGCGVGNWLKVWRNDLNVADIQGVEGPYISKEVLQIPSEFVLLQDLKLPLQVSRKFDLAMSLEVAEHLPEAQADHFVKTLTGLSNVVLFSASIPGQDGTYHINEQVPEYWAKKFKEQGYVVIDCIRDQIWGNKQVEWWYQQNIFLYVKKEVLGNFPLLTEAAAKTNSDQLLRIHPDIYFYNFELAKKSKSIISFIRWKLYPIKKWLRKKK